MDPTERANELIELTSALTELVEQENELLRSHRIRDIAGLQKQKSSLADLYQIRLREVTEDADALRTLEPGLRDRLREVSETFEESAKRNMYALKAAMILNNRLVEAVARSIEQQRVTPNGYTSTGADASSSERSSQTAIPIALDEQL
jgi:flagellar biosynthesis/type III secretory pathway chaperone